MSVISGQCLYSKERLLDKKIKRKRTRKKKLQKSLITSDQSINLLQMLAAFLCGETQIVPEIYGIIIFFQNFHEIWTREILINISFSIFQ
jgi:hypothetical protein